MAASSPSSPSPSVSLHDVSFAWPGEPPVLRDVDVTFPPGVTGVVGDNGCGKSTLLELIRGAVRPTSGAVVVTGAVGHLPQDPGHAGDATVAEVLGVADTVRAVRAVTGGSAAPADLAAVGDDWLVEERVTALLSRIGLDGVGVDRCLSSLSGGEVVLVGLAAALVDEPGVLLLDEPTNSLDRHRRAQLLDAVAAHDGCVVVVSHDRTLLSRVDRIAEVVDGHVRVVTGDLHAYRATVAHERELAEQRLRTARSERDRQQRVYAEALIKLDRRARYGRRTQREGGMPKVLAGKRQRAAQVSGGRLRGTHEAGMVAAEAAYDAARAAAAPPGVPRLELPGTAVPSGRRVATCTGVLLPYGGPVVSLDLRGPERIALTGRNGIGKTTLLRVLAGDLAPAAGTCRVDVPVGHLPQRNRHLDAGATVLAAIRAHAPGTSDHALRAALARLDLRGDTVDRPVATLSGGQRFRAALAAVLLATPAPQLLLLDEPTGDLDLASVDVLVEALAAHRGALVVVTHDDHLLADLDVHGVVELTGRGAVRTA